MRFHRRGAGLARSYLGGLLVPCVVASCDSARVVIVNDDPPPIEVGTAETGANEAAGRPVDGDVESASDAFVVDGNSDAALPDSAPFDSAVASCAVSDMVALYPGALPPNPYAAGPTATTCVKSMHDVVIVLGCPSNDDGTPSTCQTARADIAAALQKKGWGSSFIVSGAAVKNAHVEATALKALLVSRGVGADRIWMESKAEHTDENLYFSSKIMQAQGWLTALVVSDDPGHLVMTAVCDSNCCVDMGRLTIFDFKIPLPKGDTTQKIGHYVLYSAVAAGATVTRVTKSECAQVEQPLKFMCTNLASRRSCAGAVKL